jgi:excisionase family DNA binding protein
MENEKWYTLREIADLLNVTVDTVQRWTATKELESVNVGTEPGKKVSRIRVRATALQRFLDARSTGKPAAAKPKRSPRSGDSLEFIK